MNGCCLVSFFLVVIFLGFLNGRCPDGFTHHEQSCYHFSHHSATWLSALDLCEKQYGAHLAEIETEQEYQYLQERSFHDNENYWVGGDDLQVEGDWRWQSTGLKIPIHTEWWLLDNPSNDHGAENCLELNDETHRSYLNDRICSHPNRYICEKQTQSGIIG